MTFGPVKVGQILFRTACEREVVRGIFGRRRLGKERRSASSETGERNFYAIMQPDTITYNSMLNTYAAIGNVDEVCRLYHEMQTDFASGKNKDCCPDMHTYASILNALQKSNPSDAAEVAEQIFSAIPSPNTIAYNTLINMYAQKGNVDKALILLHRMQTDWIRQKQGLLPQYVHIRLYSKSA
jgi:pentatricopeptide repeat protein